MIFARRARRWMTIPGAGIAGGTPLYLTGATWAIDGNGRAYNTPTLGAELLTNGGFDSDLSGWTVSTSGTAVSVAGGQSGNCAELTNVASQVLVYQAVGGTNGRWSIFQFYQKNGTTGGIVRVGSTPTGSDIAAGGVFSSASWALRVISFRSFAATIYPRFATDTATASQTTLYDSASLKLITTATLLATTQGTSNQTPLAKVYAITTGTQAGAIGWLDDTDTPANFVIAYRDGTTAKLDKCVAGTYTNLISISSTFVQDAAIEIRRPSGNTFQLWYNGSQVGTNQTINDTAIADNTAPYYGAFSTYEGNTFTQFTLDGTEYLFPGA